MLHELRIYSTVPGRLPDLIRRFEVTTLGLWNKHGIRQAGFWTTMIGPSSGDLTYMLAWDSLADREARWTAFQSDPKWIAARAESEKNGPIIANVASSILVPTSFSAK